MRTTIDVQDDVLQEVIRQTGARSKKMAVETALKEFIRYKRRVSLSQLIGNHESYALTLDDLKKMREGA